MRKSMAIEGSSSKQEERNSKIRQSENLALLNYKNDLNGNDSQAEENQSKIHKKAREQITTIIKNKDLGESNGKAHATRTLNNLNYTAKLNLTRPLDPHQYPEHLLHESHALSPNSYLHH